MDKSRRMAVLPTSKDDFAVIGNPLRSNGQGNILGAADEILDLERGKFQSEINGEVKDALESLKTLPAASTTVTGGIRLGHDNKLLYEYPVEVDGEGRAYVSVPQRELSGLQRIEFEAYANDYAGIWSTSASDTTHMDFVMGDNIDAGNINDTFRWRFTKANLLGTATSPDKPRESDLHTIMELYPHGTLGGVLVIADSKGVMQQVLTKADFASIVVDDVTDENIKDVVKQLLSIVRPRTN